MNTLKRTLRYVFRARPFGVILREFSLIVQVAIDIYAISIWGKFIDATASFITGHTVFSMNAYFLTDSFYFLLIGTALWLTSFSIERMRMHLALNIANHLTFLVQSDYFDKISGSNLQDIESKEFRDLMTFGNKYGQANLWNTYKTFTDIIKSLVTGISALVILLQSIGLWAPIIIVFVIPEAVIGYISRKKIRRYQEKELERIKWLDYVENLMTRINNFSEMRVDGTFHNIKKEYNDKSHEFMSNVVELDKHMQIDYSFFSVIGKVFLTIFNIFLIAISLAKSFTIGHFKALYDYTFSVYDNFFKVFDMTFNISNFLDYNHKYFEFLNYQGFGDIKHGDVELKKGPVKLELRKLDFGYPDGKNKSLENVNLTIDPGEKIMILGDDSSGKSTFVKVICGLYQVVAGDYEIDGYSIRELNRGELKKKISVVFQDYINYNMTLRKNITLSSDEKRFNKERFNKAIEIAGLDKLMDKLNIPENQALGKYTSGGKDVSPGFWQRLAIARMVYRNRDILILDEPFTYIDDAEENRILEQLFNYVGRDKTIIYITRDNTHRQFFDRIYRLKKGKLIKG